jgi:hypothetical protein
LNPPPVEIIFSFGFAYVAYLASFDVLGAGTTLFLSVVPLELASGFCLLSGI